MIKIQEMAHALIQEIVEPGDLAIDATMGKGYDTLFLAELGARVLAFDLQELAVAASRERLAQAGQTAKLILDGHEKLADYVSEPVKAAIFNLGYLPGSDKSIVTRGENTIQALESLKNLLVQGGRIVLVIYHGHPGGAEEKNAVLDWCSALPQQAWHVMQYAPLNQIHTPPFLVVLGKR